MHKSGGAITLSCLAISCPFQLPARCVLTRYFCTLKQENRGHEDMTGCQPSRHVTEAFVEGCAHYLNAPRSKQLSGPAAPPRGRGTRRGAACTCRRVHSVIHVRQKPKARGSPVAFNHGVTGEEGAEVGIADGQAFVAANKQTN